jgi:uncharacterized alkaline shock family protein YloU
MDYGHPIPAVAQELRQNVIDAVERGTGLVVKEVNIEVTDLHVPAPTEPAPAANARVE